MSADATLAPERDASSPTSVRLGVLAVTTLMSVLLYLDRYAVGIASEYIREDLRMTQTQMAWFISAFFWSYALCQVPAGWLSDRFGGRVMLTVYIIAWSAFTGLLGFADAVWVVLWLRLVCGAAQAGAYPTAASMVRHWFPISRRGSASSIVGLGGRFGGVLAPILTASLIVVFLPGPSETKFKGADILDEDAFVARFDPVDDSNPVRQQFVTRFVLSLPQPEREVVVPGARVAAVAAEVAATAKKGKTAAKFDLRDWIPGGHADPGRADRDRPPGIDEIVTAISTRITSDDFVDFAKTPVKLSHEGRRLLEQRNEGHVLSEAETIRLNRLALESMFPNEIRKDLGAGWRPTMILYGIIGLIIAAAFAIVVRNGPLEHPWCNAAEQAFIDDHATRAARALEPQNPPFPWRAFLTNLSLWGNSMTQFLTNIGWLFIVTWLPRYLDKVHGVPLVWIGFMTAFPIGAGIIGMFGGGRWTDWAARRFGLKWGRRLPLVLTRFVAASGYGLCLLLSWQFAPDPDNWWLPWLYIGALCIASMSADFGTPAIWAYTQDVGGRYTASILGWSNMWGNLGAAFAPLIYDACLGEHPQLANWNSVFTVCCGVFILAGLFAMLLDASKPVTAERRSL
jgi:ACS family glucarate transporter-like MFS transporter